MSYTGSQLINRALVIAGLDEVSDNQIAAVGSPGYKCYVSSQEALEAFIGHFPFLSFNIPEKTINALAGATTLTVDTEVNLNLLYHVLYGSKKETISQTSYKNVVETYYPRYSDPINAIKKKPDVYYIDSIQGGWSLNIFPKLSEAATFYIKAQELPQEFTATAAPNTNLKIVRGTFNILAEMTAWRFEDKMGKNFGPRYDRVENPINRSNAIMQLKGLDRFVENEKMQRIVMSNNYRKRKFR